MTRLQVVIQSSLGSILSNDIPYRHDVLPSKHTIQWVKSKGKVKFQDYPTTSHKFPEGGYSCSSILSLTSARNGGGLSTQRPGVLHPESLVTLCKGSWLGLRARLDGAENLAHTGIRSPDLPALNKSLYQLRYPGPTIQRVPEIKRPKGETEIQQRSSTSRKNIMV